MGNNYNGNNLNQSIQNAPGQTVMNQSSYSHSNATDRSSRQYNKPLPVVSPSGSSQYQVPFSPMSPKQNIETIQEEEENINNDVPPPPPPDDGAADFYQR